MAESFIISTGTKQQQYELLIAHFEAVLDEEAGQIANMANMCAMLKEQFNWLWVGFYLVQENELVVGPYQGPLACTRIQRGKGVCGKSWQSGKPLIVPDVNQFSGHIACSSLSQSEIVIPLSKEGIIVAVFDADAETRSCFDEVDLLYLERLLCLL